MSVSPVDQKVLTSDSVPGDVARLREVTGRVVGSVFFGTLLKTMRHSALQGRYGHGGRGEEVFAAQLDAVLAERAGTAVQRGLDDALFARLRPQQERMAAQRQHVEASQRLKVGELPGLQASNSPSCELRNHDSAVSEKSRS